MVETTLNFLVSVGWKASHRSKGEQFVGFVVILFGTLAFAWLDNTVFSLQRTWLDSLRTAPWSMSPAHYPLITSAIYAFSSFSFWSLWRRHSLRILKLEVALFVSMFIWGSIWSLSLYGIHSTLLGMIASFLWMSNGICITALLWKRETAAGISLLPLLIWILYLLSVNMVLCIANP